MTGISQKVGNFSEQVWGTSVSVVRAHACNDAQYHNHAPARWWHNDCIPGDNSG